MPAPVSSRLRIIDELIRCIDLLFLYLLSLVILPVCQHTYAVIISTYCGTEFYVISCNLHSPGKYKKTFTLQYECIRSIGYVQCNTDTLQMHHILSGTPFLLTGCWAEWALSGVCHIVLLFYILFKLLLFTPVIERPEGVRDDPILHNVYIYSKKVKEKEIKERK